MPAINLAYLELRLSGGAANQNPAASLGGAVSSKRILSKTAVGAANITGIVLDDAPGSANGAGTLMFSGANKTLQWMPNGGTAGDPVPIIEDGRYAVPGGEGYLCVTATLSALPTSNQSDTLTVSPVMNALFDDISKLESYEGDTEYRCFYLYNAHPSEPFIGCKVYIGAQPVGADTLMLGVDPAGIGDGSSTGVAGMTANENTAPAGVNFSVPAAIGSALSIGSLAAGKGQAIWQRRSIPGQTLTSVAADVSHLVFNVGY
jgi:hypothetical protein